MNTSILESLIKKAMEIANENFCCKHTNFTVGTILVTKDNKIYKGFNVENDGLNSICAERTAFVKALSELEHNFKCLIVVGKSCKDKYFKKITPCGYCRQFISEYVDSDFQIITYDEEENKVYSYTINELLPNNFSFKEENN